MQQEYAAMVIQEATCKRYQAVTERGKIAFKRVKRAQSLRFVPGEGAVFPRMVSWYDGGGSCTPGASAKDGWEVDDCGAVRG